MIEDYKRVYASSYLLSNSRPSLQINCLIFEHSWFSYVTRVIMNKDDPVHDDVGLLFSIDIVTG